MGKLLQKSDFKLNHWSGGTTTELYIYPEHSDFKKGDFDFRLSIATVETAKATFTKLPGIKRKLLLLEGELILKHAGHHQIKLTPFERDVFSGDWETKSEGKVKDFNLMLTGNNEGEFEVIHSEYHQDLSIESNADIICFYMQKGSVLCEAHEINQGALYQIKSPAAILPVKLREDSTLILVRIKLN